MVKLLTTQRKRRPSSITVTTSAQRLTSQMIKPTSHSMMPTCRTANCWLMNIVAVKTCPTSSMARNWMKTPDCITMVPDIWTQKSHYGMKVILQVKNMKMYLPLIYCHGNPICLFDPDGQGDYYTNEGVWLGSDQKKDNVVYTDSGVHQSKNKNGSMVNVFENPRKLSISHSKFISQSSTVYGESSAYRVRDKKSEPSEDLKKEMYAIASVHQRNSKAYGISSEPTKDFRSKSAKERNDLPLMRTAIATEINALKNGIDYGYGATMWDGAEQAQFSENEQRKSNGHFEIHMNTMGWNISPKHYAQWKNNIGKSFKAPMIRAARDSFYNSVTKKSIPNPIAGKVLLQSTAVYGRTM